jgi:hypothetical protein
MKSLPGLRVCVTALASIVKLLFAPSAISNQRSELRRATAVAVLRPNEDRS